MISSDTLCLFCVECGFRKAVHFPVLAHKFHPPLPDQDPECRFCGSPLSFHEDSNGRARCHQGKGFALKVARLSDDQMPDLGRNPHPSIPRGVYRHYKHAPDNFALYEVVGGSFFATGEGQEIHVLYRPLNGGYIAHREPDDFLELITPGVRRFTLLRELPESLVGGGLIFPICPLSAEARFNVATNKLVVTTHGAIELHEAGLARAKADSVAERQGYDPRSGTARMPEATMSFGIRTCVYEYDGQLPSVHVAVPEG